VINSGNPQSMYSTCHRLWWRTSIFRPSKRRCCPKKRCTEVCPPITTTSPFASTTLLTRERVDRMLPVLWSVAFRSINVDHIGPVRGRAGGIVYGSAKGQDHADIIHDSTSVHGIILVTSLDGTHQRPVVGRCNPVHLPAGVVKNNMSI
jgi:hypothetical protein